MMYAISYFFYDFLDASLNLEIPFEKKKCFLILIATDTSVYATEHKSDFFKGIFFLVKC